MKHKKEKEDEKHEEPDGDEKCMKEEEEVVSEELEDFIQEGIEAGLSEEEIEQAIAENFTFEEETVDYDVDMSEHVDALLAGENLSEEFKSKATTIFEAAVKTKLQEEIALLEQAYAETLEERVAEIQEQLASDVDDYLNYVVEQWMQDNELAIESGLRSELSEEFIAGLRNLFAEHYIDVPEDKVNLVEELASKVEELESKLDEEIERGISYAKALVESRKNEITHEVCEGLTTPQVEKIKSLAESVEFSTEDEYKTKLETIRENYFPSGAKKATEDQLHEQIEDAEGEKKVIADPFVAAVSQAISKTKI